MLSRIDYPTAVICLIVSINAMGVGLIMPIMPDLLSSIGISTIADAAAVGGMLSLAFAAMQFLFSPLLGALSDHFGRRPVLLGSLGLAALDYLIMALAPSLWLIFVGRTLSGVSSATFSVATAYMSDRSSVAARAKSFGIVGAAAGIGFVLGPFVGGLFGSHGPRVPFFVAAGLSASIFVITYIALPETLDRAKRSTIVLKDTNPFLPLLARTFTGSSWMIVAYFLSAIAGFAIPAIWSYFGALRFGWDSTQIGLSFGVMGLCFVVAQAVVIGPLVNRFGNLVTTRIALGSGIVGFFLMAWAPTGSMAFAILPILALHALASTTITAQMSSEAAKDQQGKIQGALSSIVAVSSMIAFPIMSQAFAVGASSNSAKLAWDGLPFLLSGLLCAFAWICMVRVDNSSSQRAPVAETRVA